MAFPSTLNNATTNHTPSSTITSAQANVVGTDLNAIGVKVGSGASVPTTTGHVLTVTGAGATAYQAAAGGGATTLDGLTDVVIATPTRGDVIAHNGTNYRNRFNGVYNAMDYGAVPDAREVADAAITAADATLTSATAAFVAGDVGKWVAIRGAGTQSTGQATTGAHRATISSINSGTSVELSAVAITTVSGAVMYMGTDNNAAIQAAVDAAAATGGTTFLPPGKYLLKADSTVDNSGVHVQVKSNTQFIGAGRNATILYPTGGEKNGLFVGVGSTDVVIRDLTIRCGVQYRGDGVKLNQCDRVLVENVDVHQAFSGFGLTAVEDVTLRGCYSFNMTAGSGVTGLNAFSVADLDVGGEVYYAPSRRVRIVDCHAVSGATTALGFKCVRDTTVPSGTTDHPVTITDCTAYGFANASFYNDNMKVKYDGCVAAAGTGTGTAQAGFWVRLSDSTVLVNCHTEGGAGTGFNLQGSKFCSMTACRARDQATFGFVIVDDGGVTSEGNVLSACLAHTCTTKGFGAFDTGGNNIFLGCTSTACGVNTLGRQATDMAVGNYPSPGDFLVAASAASAPTSTTLGAGKAVVAKETGGGTVKLYYNDAGAIKSVTLA